MKPVYIVSGISGSGKSTWIKDQLWYPNCSIVSADNYFMIGDNYHFNPAKLNEAHAFCLRAFIDDCQWYASGGDGDGEEHQKVIVVDNTNTTIEEIAPYYAVARAFGFTVNLVTVLEDVFLAFARNLHHVPLATIHNQLLALTVRKIPKYWELNEMKVHHHIQ